LAENSGRTPGRSRSGLQDPTQPRMMLPRKTLPTKADSWSTLVIHCGPCDIERKIFHLAENSRRTNPVGVATVSKRRPQPRLMLPREVLPTKADSWATLIIHWGSCDIERKIFHLAENSGRTTLGRNRKGLRRCNHRGQSYRRKPIVVRSSLSIDALPTTREKPSDRPKTSARKIPGRRRVRPGKSLRLPSRGRDVRAISFPRALRGARRCQAAPYVRRARRGFCERAASGDRRRSRAP